EPAKVGRLFGSGRRDGLAGNRLRHPAAHPGVAARTPMSLQIRLRFAKALLRRAERLSFGFGFACMCLCAFMLARAWLFQAYQDWAFDQQSRGEDASVSEFLVQAASFSGRDDTRFVALLAGGAPVAQTVGFLAPENRG